MATNINFSELVGKTIVKIKGLEKNSDFIIFETSDGYIYGMYHSQECCESVYVEDVNGKAEDLLNTPLIIAEEKKGEIEDIDYGILRYTFYTLATKNGYVDIRWHGESNGWYSVDVSLSRVLKVKDSNYYFDSESFDCYDFCEDENDESAYFQYFSND